MTWKPSKWCLKMWNYQAFSILGRRFKWIVICFYMNIESSTFPLINVVRSNLLPPKELTRSIIYHEFVQVLLSWPQQVIVGQDGKATVQLPFTFFTHLDNKVKELKGSIFYVFSWSQKKPSFYSMQVTEAFFLKKMFRARWGITSCWN